MRCINDIPDKQNKTKMAVYYYLKYTHFRLTQHRNKVWISSCSMRPKKKLVNIVTEAMQLYSQKYKHMYKMVL